jgi:hypothetical protein
MQRGPGRQTSQQRIVSAVLPQATLQKRSSEGRISARRTNLALSLLVVGRRPNSPSCRCRTSRKVGAMIGMVDILEDYEAGYLDTGETLELFAELIRTGRVWDLEPPCPSTARHLIDTGYISPGGEITAKGRALMLDEGREGSPCDANPKIIVGAFDDRPYPWTGRSS